MEFGSGSCGADAFVEKLSDLLDCTFQTLKRRRVAGPNETLSARAERIPRNNGDFFRHKQIRAELLGAYSQMADRRKRVERPLGQQGAQAKIVERRDDVTPPLIVFLP